MSQQPSLVVIKAGLLTTVQDLGRNVPHLGVPQGGAMDRLALRAANLLVGNREDAAGLEMTLTGTTLRFTHPTYIAVTGGEAAVTLDGMQVPMWQGIEVGPDSLLDIGAIRRGARVYLAVAGGLQVPLVMGSRATQLSGGYGGWQGRRLKEGDCLPYLQKAGSRSPAPGGKSLFWQALYQADWGQPIRVLPGPDWEEFTADCREQFLQQPYQVLPESNRMGYRMQGPALIRTSTEEKLPDYTMPGVIQVPPHGQPLVLMAECQVTGGYPVLAVVVSGDLPRLAQVPLGGEVRFAMVSLAEAHALRLAQERQLRIWKWLLG